MKILFVTSQVLFPPFSGLRKKIFLFAKELKKQGHKLYLYSFANFDTKNINFFEEIQFVPPLSNFTIFKNLLFSTFKSPLEIVFCINRKAFVNLKSFVKKIKPDLIFIDYIRIAHVFPYVKGSKVILNMDDPQSLKYINMKKFIKDIENPFGEATYSLPHLIRKILKTYFIKRLLLSYEIKMMRRYEKYWSRFFKFILTNSELDKKYLENNGIKNVILFPPAVEIKEELKIDKKDNYLLFVGKMDYAPNPDAVLYFVKKIFPYIREKLPEIEFWIVGSNLRDDLKSTLTGEKNVKLLGTVDNLEPLYKKAAVFVSPLRFGTGIKVKLLEAMRFGAPIVTTYKGAEGIGVENGKHLLIAKDEDDFARKIIRLIEDNDLRMRLIINAYNFVKENYEISKVTKNLLEKIFV
ncbi:MAG: glycosyltransferase family 4 protein [Candidatus Hydrothermales bacterium]